MNETELQHIYAQKIVTELDYGTKFSVDDLRVILDLLRSVKQA